METRRRGSCKGVQLATCASCLCHAFHSFCFFVLFCALFCFFGQKAWERTTRGSYTVRGSLFLLPHPFFPFPEPHQRTHVSRNNLSVVLLISVVVYCSARFSPTSSSSSSSKLPELPVLPLFCVCACPPPFLPTPPQVFRLVLVRLLPSRFETQESNFPALSAFFFSIRELRLSFSSLLAFLLPPIMLLLRLPFPIGFVPFSFFHSPFS